MTTVTTREAAEIIGCQMNTVSKLAQTGQIPADKINGRWYLDEAAVRAYVPPKPVQPTVSVNRAFTLADRRPYRDELEDNRRIMAERIAAARPGKAVFLDSAGERIR
jgi:excisionase family DNA binding protein